MYSVLGCYFFCSPSSDENLLNFNFSRPWDGFIVQYRREKGYRVEAHAGAVVVLLDSTARFMFVI